MSNIQTSIQKAIDKSKGSDRKNRKKPNHNATRGKSAPDGLGSGVFRLFQAAEIDRQVMEQNRLVAEVDDRAAISAYKLLRTRVLQRMRSNNWRSLVVTSPGANEGKSLTALNLALSLSRDVNQSVLLIDLDLQRSRIAQYIGFSDGIEKGISEYLMGTAEVADIVYAPSDLPRLSVIPNVGITENSSDLLSGPRMRELLDWIELQSDRTIVIYDMPPVLAADDVLAFSTEVDAILLVVTQGKTDRSSLENAANLLSDTNLLGVVLNKCSEGSTENVYAYY